MTPNIRNFIEKHILLLEKDPAQFFVNTYESGLDRADVAYMSALLSEAGIQNIEESRNKALLELINDQINEWNMSDGGVTSMPVYDFIQAFLDSCVGFEENYVLLFIKKNQNKWKDKARIYMLHDMTVIEKVW